MGAITNASRENADFLKVQLAALAAIVRQQGGVITITDVEITDVDITQLEVIQYQDPRCIMLRYNEKDD